MNYSKEESRKQKRKKKQCHRCDSMETTLCSELFYGHRNGVYVGGYTETFYACKKHEQYWAKEQCMPSVKENIASIFYTDLMKLINSYCQNGLSKKDLVKNMEYAIDSCKMS